MKPHLPITFLIALLGCFVVNAVEYDGLDNLSFVSQSSSTNGGALSAFNIKISNITDNINSTTDVSFTNNDVDGTYLNSSELKGGAIYSNECSILDNGSISFERNRVSHTSRHSLYKAQAYGGAIHSESNISFIRNENISFKNNYSEALQTYEDGSISVGGAISSYGCIEISENNNISFSQNYTHSDIAYYTSVEQSYGGAIYSIGGLKINNNETVIFSRNHTYAGYLEKNSAGVYADCRGGAIYSNNDIFIQGNESVIFDGNYETNGRDYFLKSIHLESGSLHLSTDVDGHITFYDSVFMEHSSGVYVSLNADYQDAQNITQKATGDIVFSGKYTEDHLKEIKGGTEGTASEITNSRTSELLNTVNLYGGTLRVEDKAVLKTHAINVTDGSNATMKVADAQVNASGYNITVNRTGTLEIGGTDGSSKITAKNIDIEEGATLSVARVVDPSEVITLAEAESVNIYNEKLGGIVSGNLNMQAGSTYKADGAHLSVLNGTLTFNSTAEEKINLVLTLMERYDKDSQVMLFTDVNTVKFVLDNITASKTGQVVTLNAADYFTGDWINENTTLVYDKGSIYVSGVNRVIPEPTTATLSLLALAALASRRRRK